MIQVSTSIIDAFISLFKSLPTEAQEVIRKEIYVEKATALPILKKDIQIKLKLSSLKGKVSKMTTQEIGKQLKSLRNEWLRDI